MVTTFYPPYHFGGDAVYAYRLSQELAARGHQVDVVHSVDAYRLLHPADPELPFEHHPNVRRLPLETSHPFLAALAAHQLGRPALYGPRLRSILAPGRYDVIHFHNTSLMGAPGVLALGDAVKLYTANEYWLICSTHVLFHFNREACVERQCLECTLRYRRPPQIWRATGAMARGLEHVDCILAPSRFALEQHRAQGIDRPMLHLPYLIPDPSEDEPVAGVPLPERPYFLYVGRLEKLKGVQELLRLFRDYDAADLVILGTGDYEAELRSQARGLTHVHFFGNVHPRVLGHAYRQAVAVLVPSLCYETFGLIAAEAMSHGTPAIVRRIGALEENMRLSGGGLTFTTLEECRAAMDALLTQPELRDRLGNLGRKAVQRYWSVGVHLEKYLGLARRLVDRRAAGPEVRRFRIPEGRYS